MTKMKVYYILAFSILLGAAQHVHAEKVTSHTLESGMTTSLQNETRAAIERGKDWLVATQKRDGHWSNPEFPALTALPLWALAIDKRDEDQGSIDSAVNYILSCVHPNGAIYREPNEKRKGGGLSNYNTAVCMVALNAVGRPSLVPIIQKAREFLAGTQHFGDDIYAGGMGYDASSKRAYTDLSNSYLAFEAMRLTEGVEDLRGDGEKRADLDWKAARAFIQRCQNDPDFNQRPWVNTDPEEKGGFVYNPDQTRAGVTTNKNGLTLFRSMPGMSYAGLLSYIYADVDRDDPRVEATINWAINHWSLDEASRDPSKHGTDAANEGLFYMLNVMTKGLSAYGQDVFTPEHGAAFNWRVQMIEKLISMQKTNDEGQGYWINEVSRYWEGDRTLVSAYSLISLQIAAGK